MPVEFRFMKQVTSKDNPRYKWLRKLNESARFRQEEGRTLLDGIHLLAAYRAVGGMPDLLAIRESGLSDPALVQLLEGMPETATIVLPDSLLRELSPVKTPTGAVAAVAIPDPTSVIPGQFSVFLEDIQDPGNLGAILRSAAAAGADSAYLSAYCADAWSPKVLRAGMGAHFCLPIHQNSDLEQMATAFPGVTAAAVLGGEKSLFDLDLVGATAFIIGNEGAGISSRLAAAATCRFQIPMSGPVESLNAGAAAAVCFFERVRQVKQVQKSVTG